MLARRIFQRLRTGDFHQQRVCVKFSFKLRKTISDTSEMLKQAFEDEAISRTRTREWYKRLNAGRCSVEDSESSGSPSTSKT